MVDKEREFRRILTLWQEKVLMPQHEELAQRLSESELSALYACLPDCFDSFFELYHELLPALAEVRSDDHQRLHDYIFDIGGIAGVLQHIKDHIITAEKGFEVLIQVLAEKGERKH